MVDSAVSAAAQKRTCYVICPIFIGRSASLACTICHAALHATRALLSFSIINASFVFQGQALCVSKLGARCRAVMNPHNEHRVTAELMSALSRLTYRMLDK